MAEKKPKKVTVTDDSDEEIIDLHESGANDKEIEDEIDKLAESVKEPEEQSDDFDEEIDKNTPIGELAEKPLTTETDKEFSDPSTSKAVDDIVAKETDELLEAEDQAKERSLAASRPKRGSWGRFKEFVAGLWENPASRWGIIVGFALLVILVGVLPATRYGIFNLFGVRASSSVKIIDGGSLQPLKNVTVKLQGQEKQTNDEGKVSFDHLKLGKSELVVIRRGFAEHQQNQTLGWGSNPLKDVSLTAVGSQFAFKLTDHLSGKPVVKAEAVSGEFSAFANPQGEISLVIDEDSDNGTVNVDIIAEGYRTEKVTFNATDKSEKDLGLVAGNPDVFISKRTGRFNLFKIDADGKNETVLLEATGKERDDMALLAHPTQNRAALVSTRDGVRNSGGFLMSGLFAIDVASGASKKIAESERVQLVGWQGDYLVYVLITEGASAANPKRSRLMSYDARNDTTKELASANYFNDVYAVKNVIYYAPSAYAVPVSGVKFFKIAPDGSGQQTLFDQEVWSILRGSYDTLYLSVQQNWYELKIGTTNVVKMASPPPSQTSIIFEDNAERTKSLWADKRDGKGVLLLRTVADSQDATLKTEAGLGSPLRWLNSTTALYRVVSGNETADYVISTEGGEAKKITDVTNTNSAESFFYY